MEALMRARKQHRRLFTRACNEYENDEPSLSTQEKISRLRMIEKKASMMISSEEATKQLMYSECDDEEEIDRECDESETYIDRWSNLEQKLQRLVLEENTDTLSNYSVSAKNTLLNYPKIKLPAFNGDVRKWLGFWGQFKKIDENPDLDLHDKFAYLLQAMERGSTAEELINSFPPGGDSYEKALKMLKTRFGRDELLIQVYVRDLLGLVLQRQRSSKGSLRKLYDELESKLRALEILGVTTDKYAAMLFPLVESSLPEETLIAWERCRSNHQSLHSTSDHVNQSLVTTEINVLEKLLEFLQKEVESEERIKLAFESFGKSTSRSFNKREVKFEEKLVSERDLPEIPSAYGLLTYGTNKVKCIFCTGQHFSGDCMKARHMPITDREERAKRSGSCFWCLRQGHTVHTCHLKINCLHCGKKHHVLLCRSASKRELSASQSQSSPKSRDTRERDCALANVSSPSSVMLQTLTVVLRGVGKRRQARAIIDTASERSYILNNTAREMGYRAKKQEYLRHSLFGGNTTDLCQHDVFTVFLSNVEGGYSCNFEVLGQAVICDTAPPQVQKQQLKQFANLGVQLYDDSTRPIEVLIGANVAGKLMTGGRKLLPCGLAAIKTFLGWTVMGRMPQRTTRINDSATMAVTSMLSTAKSVSDLWTLDSLGITDPSVKKNQSELHEAAKQHFLDTVSVENDRYVVHLPWVEEHPPLPNNFDLALKRLHSTTKRLKSQSLYNAYEKVFLDWEEEGIIEEVKEEASDKQVQAYYLPHHAVLKESKTTPIRPVFDASVRLSGYPGLNDCLEKGPNLIELIPTILMRFRYSRIGVASDIKKAFLQIGVAPTDRNYLRFLWRNEGGSLKIYRHCRVVFGVSSSPFLLGATIQYHLEQILEKMERGECFFPQNIIQKLMRSFYVDNCVTSVRNEEELNLFIEVSTKVMAEKKFELRGWEYTDPKATEFTDSKILGMVWDKKDDTLRINLGNSNDLCFKKVSKRSILSAAHRLFDPIGVTCPTSLIPKMLLQKTCKLNWDEEVDSDVRDEFLRWIRDVVHLENIRIPRYIGLSQDLKSCSVHIFCDASKSAYACVAFVRVETSDDVKVHLIQAKSRIAPTGKEQITIARLELLAASIAARMSVTVLEEIIASEVWFWSDSSTVIAWITREEPWGIFVYNRVKEIRELTSKYSWRHLPGVLNPADLPSRGCSPRHLLKSRWWKGPDWLYLSRERWPNSDMVFDEQEVSKERKKGVVSSTPRCLLAVSSTVKKNWYYQYFSKYSTIVKLVAWVLRFCQNCKVKKPDRRCGDLDSTEIIEAELKVLRMVQEESFESKQDERLKSLRAYKDQDNIIRVKTKLDFREDFEDFKSPIILPSKHDVVKSLIIHYHEKNAHVGTQILLNILRERFWILNGKKAVRSIVSKCVVCKRFSSRPLEVVEPPLPPDRVQEASVFEICGVDLAGPLFLKDRQKSWVCVFTCAVYRAVHFELVTSISTESFLLALRRFIARRGRCKVIYCDNGTNFVGASNAFQSLNWSEIKGSTALSAIRWKFNPPTASWWGGWWERIVGILKNLLRRVLGRASLTYEEMLTVLCDCEAIINSRPLTYVSENESELAPLSPSMFLQDVTTIGVPDFDAIDHHSMNRRLKYRRNLQKNLRDRFRSEYLGALVQKQRDKRKTDISEGDVVLIGSDNRKRIDWPLGLVIETTPGRDGVVRLVKLRTAHGVFLRPIQRIYPLELSSVDPIRSTKSAIAKEEEEISAQTQRDEPTETKQTIKTRYGRNVKIPERITF